MKNKPLFISITSLIIAISLSAYTKGNSNEIKAESPLQNNTAQTCYSQNSSLHHKEMRAVWVPFMALDMKNSDHSETAFKTKFDNIISEALSNNLNTLIVHVRPFSDALYTSKYFPWSHLLTEEQGKNPGFDPLEYMVSASHKAGLQFHAWINPLRIQVNDKPAKLCDSSIYFSLKNSNNPEDIILETENGKYLNPAYPQVHKLIIDGVREIVENYPLDGIQFDDYFYPENEFDVDKVSYENYCNSPGNTQPLSLKEWRFANINSLVSGTYSAIKNINPNIIFGISPSGNLANNEKIGADVATWCKTPGYIDYICPQIYFSLEHPILPAETAAIQWKSLPTHDNVKLYYGLAVYKAGSEIADNGTWKNRNDILKTQVEKFRQLGCDGFMFFSIDDFKKAEAASEVKNVVSILN